LVEKSYIYVQDTCTQYDSWTKFNGSTECTISNLNATGLAHYYTDTSVCGNSCYAKRAYCERPKVYNQSLGTCSLPDNCVNPQTQCEDFGSDFGGWKYRTVCDNDTSSTNRPYTTDVTGFCTLPDGNNTNASNDINTSSSNSDNNTSTYDINNSANNTNSTGTTTNTSTDNNTTISNDGSILAAINSSNVHLSKLDTDLGTISGRVKVAGDINHAETKYQGDRLHDDLNNLRISNNNNHDNLMNSVGNIETNLGYMHNQLGTVIDELRKNNSNSSNGDSNTSNDFNDSRIVEANNNTTRAINDLKNMDRDKVDDTLSYLDDLNSTLTDFSDLVDDLKTSLDNIKSSFTNVYNPTFPNPSSCIYNFKVFKKYIPIDICEKVSPLRPYIVFILSVYFLKLLVDMHLFFIFKMKIKI